MHLIPELIDSQIVQSKLGICVSQEILEEVLTYIEKSKFLSFMFKVLKDMGPAPLDAPIPTLCSSHPVKSSLPITTYSLLPPFPLSGCINR